MHLAAARMNEVRSYEEQEEGGEWKARATRLTMPNPICGMELEKKLSEDQLIVLDVKGRLRLIKLDEQEEQSKV